ncbi:uncharacterized protein VP01_844g4 [Puccinia sorghi]|uniref:Uncharacterized protein n=1 Tax=Puccinia sorghi TaxID=27349 RepID=A0A0L6U9A4_9BASI|nr:uncharacterized protein VP01_844g4 [Puccinia sorghi]
MRFAIVAASAVVLGATVAEARSVASSPRRHVEKVMKRTNAHETRVEIERLSFATPSRLSKRSKLANEDCNNATCSPDQTISISTSTTIVKPLSLEASMGTHTRATERSNLDHSIHRRHHHKERIATSKPAFVDRTVTSNPSEALPNNVIWTIEKNPDADAIKAGGPKFTITPTVPTDKKTKQRKAAEVLAPIAGNEYMIIPVTPAKPTIDALPAASPIAQLLAQENQITPDPSDAASTTALLSAIEKYRVALDAQTSDPEKNTAQADVLDVSAHKSRAAKKNSIKSLKKSQKERDDCGSESEDTSSDSFAPATDFRTILTSEESE